MKKLFLILPIILAACSSSVQIITDIRSMHHYEVREDMRSKIGDSDVFRISCRGNDFASSAQVDDRCLHDIAEFAHGRGRAYFNILSQDLDAQMINNMIPAGDGTFVPITSVQYESHYTFVLISAGEKANFPDFHRVSDYYAPGAKDGDK